MPTTEIKVNPYAAVSRSLSKKLLVIIAATVFLALSMSAVALVIYDVGTYRDRLAEELNTLADMVARASGPGLVFNDRKSVEENLDLLRAHPKIVTSAVYTAQGDLFASAGQQAAPRKLAVSDAPGYRLLDDKIVLSKAIFENDQLAGFAYLVARYEAGARIARYLGILATVMLLSLLAAVGISLGLQRSISRPIQQIARAARLVSREKNFSHQVEKKTEDELGDLADAFNTMLQEVGSRTAQIEAAHRSLQAEVEERRQTEAALRESEERFRVLADHAPVLVWLNDENGCAFVNREYLRFTGRSVEELAGTGWQSGIHPDDERGLKEQYAAAVEERTTFDYQFRYRRADGVYRWLKSVGVPRFTDYGRFIGYVGCSADITEIQESMEELAHAEKALREADRQKDEFLAVLSHELRNPLHPILSAVAILRASTPRDGKAAWAHGVIDRQVRHLARLLEDLLDASRIATGKLELRRERLELSSIVDMALETTRPAIDAAGHHLAISVPPEPIWLDADPARLAQVLSNLLSNAAKYTNTGGHIRLTISTHGAEALIRVADDGIGIPRRMLPHVFEMFYQANGDVKRGGGLGIGLALVKGLVEKHGGRIDVESAGVGLGSAFTLVLPLAAAPAADMAAAETDRARPAKSLRILIADDIPDARDTLATLLRLSGHEVEEASDGAEAIDKALRLRPDVAILDIGMPGTNGYEAAAGIRNGANSSPFLIALSGYGQSEDIERAMKAGFDRHLTKPVDIEILYRLLDEAA